MPIPCHLYDAIELVCLYHYEISLALIDGGVISGTAIDTTRNKSNDECIKLESIYKNALVALSDIKTMTVQTKNPNLSVVHFHS